MSQRYFCTGILISTQLFLVLVPLSAGFFNRVLPIATTETIPFRQVLHCSATKVYFDVEISDEPIGRLVFHLSEPSPLPLHTENLVKLCTGDMRSIEPSTHYVGCAFEYNANYIEDGSGRYRWGHVMKGRGRNAIGRPGELISDSRNQALCTHSCFGGQYYGEEYIDLENDPGVMLTVQVSGPGRGSSRFSIVRVGESPPEWRERLLLNSGVVGRLDPESLETLHAMARQIKGPPIIAASGVM
mmetsp:Transcript_15016/g.22923  ORF Transcript_15016/g.22923 Transcript_15016/m.22923 type:complete len:243 (-) Transcript_15016:246-974(-)